MGCLRKVFNVLEDHSGETQARERQDKWGLLREDQSGNKGRLKGR